MVGLKASSEVWVDFMLPKSKRSSVHRARLSALFKILAADRLRTRPVVMTKEEYDPMGELLGAAEDDTLDEELELAILQGSKRAMKRYKQFGAVRGRPRMPVAVQGSSRRASRWVAVVVVDPSWTTPVLFETRTQQPAILATGENLEKLLEKFVATEAGSSPDVDGSSTARAALSEPLLHRWMKLDGRAAFGCARGWFPLAQTNK